MRNEQETEKDAGNWKATTRKGLDSTVQHETKRNIFLYGAVVNWVISFVAYGRGRLPHITARRHTYKY